MSDEPKKPYLASKTILNKSMNPDDYAYDASFKPWDGQDPMQVHTTLEMLQAMEKDKTIEIDARVIGVRESGNHRMQARMFKMGREHFLEGFRKDSASKIKKIRENFGGGIGSGYMDWGANNMGDTRVGQDFTPLLGGPFFKNLYFYIDYIRMHADAFYAYHNDPFARAIVQITRDFVLGTGYEMACDMTKPEGKMAMAAWKAFEVANDIPLQIDQSCEELSIYGEIMLWKLPGLQSKITYRLGPSDTKPIGMIPRVRLIDPSNLVEIVTYPEDITRPLFYVWLQPTQWQIFTTAQNPQISGSTPTQPTTKFIYQEIPADQILHFKINAVSNEKRGRSDFFPVFNYLRRLRDSVHYNMISLEKMAAWSMDTTIEGNQADIDAYIQDQAAIGTIPPPGSEFIHSAAIKRSYNGIQHAGGHASDTFQWCLSCIAAGVGIPVSYFGTHLSGGTTKASALVATEPVAKKMEKRREVMKRILRKLWEYCMDSAGLPVVDVDVVFPEMISQDSTQKLQNLLLAEQARWIKPERAATMAAKELTITNYDYNSELEDVEKQLPEIPMPLADPAQIAPPNSMEPGQPTGGDQQGTPSGGLSAGGTLGSAPHASGVTGKDRVEAKANDRSY